MANNAEAEQIAILRRMVELQAQVCYHNVDRTLATWTRTALALIVTGFGVDHFGLLMTRDHPPHLGTWLAPNPESTLAGIVLVVIGTFIALSASVRHQAYRAMWYRVYRHPWRDGPWLAFTFSLSVGIFGIVLIAVLLVFVR